MDNITEPTVTEHRTLDRTAAAQDIDDIWPIIGQIQAMLPHLPKRPLSAARRRMSGANLIPNAGRTVRSLCRALKTSGAQLPEADEDPDALLALQDRADTYKNLRAFLWDLYLQVNDAYLDTQFQALHRTRAAARRIGTGRMLYRRADPRRIQREALLARLAAFDARIARHQPRDSERVR